MKKIFKYCLNLIPRPWLIKASYTVTPLLSWYYKGDTYTDPIDNKSFKSFLPYGYATVRENVLSPSTLSLERHRLLWLYLKHKTDIFTAPTKLLHFAPEQCFFTKFKESKNIDYTTTDLNSPLAAVHADICNLPFEDNSYDMILCNHVLEHIPDDHKAMTELYRVLKPGGTAILQIPLDMDRESTFEDNSITDREERTRIFGQYDHVRVYGMDYFHRLELVGFNVNPVDYTVDLGSKAVNKYRLAAGEIIPVVTKPLS